MLKEKKKTESFSSRQLLSICYNQVKRIQGRVSDKGETHEKAEYEKSPV